LWPNGSEGVLLHICMITSEFPPQRKGLKLGGVGYHSFNLCNELIKKGHRVTVFTRGFHKEPHLECMKKIDVYRITYFPLYPFNIKFHQIFVDKLFRSMESDFDLVHLQVPLPPLIDTSLPIVATVHSLIRKPPPKMLDIDLMRRIAYEVFSVLNYPLEFEILRNADLITCVSSTVAREISDSYGFDSKIKVIDNGVDTNFFVPKKSNKNFSYILWSGRIIYAKGLLDLVECAKYVCKEDSSTSFILAGTGPLMGHLKKLISNSGLEKKVILVGQLDRESLLRYYQNSTLFVLPSHHESFPNVVLEAMACGIPTVATDVGDVHKVVKDGKTGFLVSAKDPKALGQRIIELLNDEALRKRMGEASRRLVENYYSWDSISNKVIACYKLVMNQ